MSLNRYTVYIRMNSVNFKFISYTFLPASMGTTAEFFRGAIETGLKFIEIFPWVQLN